MIYDVKIIIICNIYYSREKLKRILHIWIQNTQTKEMEQINKFTDSYALMAEMQGWQEEEEHMDILEYCANLQRFSFKKNFQDELDKITSDICEADKKIFVSVDRSKFMRNLADFINENPTSTLKTFKTKTDYYLLMNLRNQTDAVRMWMIDEIYKVW